MKKFNFSGFIKALETKSCTLGAVQTLVSNDEIFQYGFFNKHIRNIYIEDNYAVSF